MPLAADRVESESCAAPGVKAVFHRVSNLRPTMKLMIIDTYVPREKKRKTKNKRKRIYENLRKKDHPTMDTNGLS